MKRTAKQVIVPILVVVAALVGCSNANLVGGRNYVSQGVYDKAVEVLERAVVELPEDPEAHYLLGKSYAEAGQHDKAPAELTRAAELDTYYAARADTVRRAFHAKLFNSGNELLAAGQYAEALDRFQKAATYQPDDVGVHQNLGFVYIKLERQVDAIAEYKKMYALDPTNVDALRTVLDILTDAGNRAEALEVAREIRAANPNDLQATSMLADMYMRDAEAAKERKDADAERAALTQAAPLYESIVAADPNNALVAFQLGGTYFSLEDFAKAAEHFEKSAEMTDPKDPLHVDSMSNLVAALYKMKQWAKAELHLNQLIALEPQECGHYRLLSGSLREQNRNNEALEAAKKYEACKGR